MTLSVQQGGGGNYTTLDEALDNATTAEDINIEGSWTADDTRECICAVDCQVTALSTSKHPGYWDTSQNHYRLVGDLNGTDAFSLNGAYTLTMDGVAIYQSSTGTSDEAVDVRPGTSDSVTLKNCLIRAKANVTQHDCVYTGHDVSIGPITLENCVMYDAGRAGVNIQNSPSGGTRSATININACTIHNTGNDAADTNGGTGGVAFILNGGGSNITVNIHSTIVAECHDGTNAADYYDTAGASCTWNIDYSVDSDNSIASVQDAGTGTGASYTITDNTSPGGSKDIIVQSLTAGSEDFRLVDNADNEAIGFHTTASPAASGLTIPGTDMLGETRSSPYDLGAINGVAVGTFAGSSKIIGGGIVA